MDVARRSPTQRPPDCRIRPCAVGAPWVRRERRWGAHHGSRDQQSIINTRRSISPPNRAGPVSAEPAGRLWAVIRPGLRRGFRPAFLTGDHRALVTASTPCLRPRQHEHRAGGGRPSCASSSCFVACAGQRRCRCSLVWHRSALAVKPLWRSRGMREKPTCETMREAHHLQSTKYSTTDSRSPSKPSCPVLADADTVALYKVSVPST